MDPVAKFDQAGARLIDTARILASMTRELVEAGMKPRDAGWLAYSLFSVLLGVEDEVDAG